MKIRFLKNVVVDVETRTGEFYDKSYSRWQEIRVDSIYPYGNFTTIKLDDETILHGVPKDSFETLKEERKTFAL